MKIRLLGTLLPLVLILVAPAFAGVAQQGDDARFCTGAEDCQAFALWSGTANNIPQPIGQSLHQLGSPQENDDQVVFEGTAFCVGVEDCRVFAFWGGTAAGYVLLTEPNGQPSDYIWVDFNGFLWFESDNENGQFAVLPPAGLPKLGQLVETGSLQQVNQFFPGAALRPLFVQSSPIESTVPEPSTLLLVLPAAGLLAGRARRLWRS